MNKKIEMKTAIINDWGVLYDELTFEKDYIKIIVNPTTASISYDNYWMGLEIGIYEYGEVHDFMTVQYKDFNNIERFVKEELVPLIPCLITSKEVKQIIDGVKELLERS